MGAAHEPGVGLVRQIAAIAWEGAGAVEPVGDGWPVADWLALLRAHDLTLGVLPISRITGGPYDGGHVLVAQDGGRLYFAVPAAAIPALAGHLPADEYAELVRRTPALWGAG